MAYSYQTSPTFYTASWSSSYSASVSAPVTTSYYFPYITSLDHFSMSKAVNDRVRNGPADCSRRIHQYILGLFRQVRNPSEPLGLPGTEQWPALAEWQETYAYVPTDDKWPAAPPGDFEGPNLASQAMAFLFGNPQIFGEGTRINEEMSGSLTGPDTPYGLWEAAKLQRGGYNPSTGDQHAPMFEAAQTHLQLTQPKWSFHGKSYGGIQPVPEAFYPMCQDGDGNVWLNQIIKFRAINDAVIENLSTGASSASLSGSLFTLTGTCGPAAGGDSGDVQYWTEEYPFAYFVLLFDGTLYRLDKADWLVIKDGGGLIQRQKNDAIQRLMLNSFLKEFRGTDAQRSGSCFDLMHVAFDYDYFFKSQYQLAPAYAYTDGGGLVIPYQNYSFPPHMPPNAASPIFSVHSGFRVGGYLVLSQNVTETYHIKYFENGQLINRHTVTPDTSSFVITLPSGSTNNCQFIIEEPVNLSGAPNITVEISELQDYKPQIYDAYAYVRQASSNGDDDTGNDTQGVDEDEAASMSQYYKESGACVNIHGQTEIGEQDLYPNANPVHEATRRQIQEWTRVMNRRQILEYEVAGGKSILYFRRYLMIGDDITGYDMWEGILDADDPINNNGIKTTAPVRGYTNEWVMDVSLNPYGGHITDPADASTFKKEVYGDYFPMIQRCQFLNPVIGQYSNEDMFAHFQQYAPGQPPNSFMGGIYAPEALSAYNYLRGVNPGNSELIQNEGKIGFYKSCQIYPDPYTVESITIDPTVSTEYGFDVVKVVFTGRFQHHDSASATVSRDFTTWDEAELANTENYRTDENGLRQFIYYINGVQSDGALVPKVGDSAGNSLGTIRTDTENFHGSLIPHFFFTKLIPSPYLLDIGYGAGQIPVSWFRNAESMSYLAQHESNTLITADRFIQMETYLRAICEGYINSSVAVTCTSPILGEVNSAYDFTWEDVNYAAHGHKWFSLLPSDLSDVNTYGPLPTLDVYAAPLNRLSAVINKLNKVRVPLPYRLLVKTFHYTGSATMTPSQGDPAKKNCSLSGQIKAAEFGYQPPSAGDLVSESDWEEAQVAFSMVSCGRVLSHCENTSFLMVTDYYKTQFKYDAVDPDALNAMNTNLRELYQGTGNSFYGLVSTNRDATCHTSHDASKDPYSPCACLESIECQDTTYGTNFFWNNWNLDGTWPEMTPCPDNYTETYCGVFDDGTVDVGGTPPAGDYFIGQETNARQPLGYIACDTNSSLNKTISVTANQEAIIKIPLI